MMQVVFLSEDCEEVIPTMCNHRLQSSRSPEQIACKDMTAQNLWRQPEWEDGRHKVLQRMCVLSSKSDGSLELMVLVVYALIEKLDVQETMRVVEDDFAAKDADDEVAHNFRCSRYGMVEAVEGWTACEMKDPELEYLCCYHQQLIENDHINAMPDLNMSWCWSRLNFVSQGEGGQELVNTEQ